MRMPTHRLGITLEKAVAVAVAMAVAVAVTVAVAVAVAVRAPGLHAAPVLGKPLHAWVAVQAHAGPPFLIKEG